MDSLEKSELTVSIRHVAIFLKSVITIYNSKVPADMAGRKTKEEEEHRELQSILRFMQTQ